MGMRCVDVNVVILSVNSSFSRIVRRLLLQQLCYVYTHVCFYKHTQNMIWFCFCFLSRVSPIYCDGDWFSNMCTFCIPCMHLLCIYFTHQLEINIRVVKLCTKRTVLAHLSDFTLCFCHIFPLLCFPFSFFHSFFLYPSSTDALGALYTQSYMQ